MILTIVIMLVVIGLTVKMIYDDLHGACNNLSYIVIAAALGTIVDFAVFLLVFFVCAGISNDVPESEKVIERVGTVEITALKDSQNINGRFYLTGGYVKEDLYYYYAELTEYGYRTSKVKADLCYIVYSDETPHIDEYTANAFKHWWTYIYAVPVHESYVIYVPVGTITTEFAIDLE